MIMLRLSCALLCARIKLSANLRLPTFHAVDDLKRVLSVWCVGSQEHNCKPSHATASSQQADMHAVNTQLNACSAKHKLAVKH